MVLKPTALARDMLNAARLSLGTDWPSVKDYAATEFRKLAQSLVNLAKLSASGTVTQQQAQALARIYQNTTQVVLLTIEGLGLIAVENAINSALNVVRDAVNAAAGLVIL